MLHGLLLTGNISLQCGLYLIGLALGRLHDGNGVAAHHHAGNAGGKGGVLAVLQVQQGHQDVPDLFVQLVGLVLGAVTVNGGKLAVLALGEDHIVLVVLVAAGVVDDLGVVLGGGAVGLAAAGAAHQSKQGQPCQQGGDEFFHSIAFPFIVLCVEGAAGRTRYR